MSPVICRKQVWWCVSRSQDAAEHPTEYKDRTWKRSYSTWNASSARVEKAGFGAIHYIFLFAGIKESDTGLAPPALWDLAADKQTLQSEQPLQVARYVSALWCLGPSTFRVWG